MNFLQKTQAMRAATQSHSYPRGYGDSWFFMAPSSLESINGPQSEVRAGSYRQAVTERSRRIAVTVLVLMGWSESDARRTIYDDPNAPNQTLARINRALERCTTEFES